MDIYHVKLLKNEYYILTDCHIKLPVSGYCKPDIKVGDRGNSTSKANRKLT